MTEATMRMPIDVIEDATAETGWDEDSKLAICLDFILAQGAEAMARFADYVAERAKEELDAQEPQYGPDPDEDNGEPRCLPGMAHKWVVSDENENLCYCENCGIPEY